MAYPFFPAIWPDKHRVTLFIMSTSDLADCVDWCIDNIGKSWSDSAPEGGWQYDCFDDSYVFYFRKNEDAMLFAARWA